MQREEILAGLRTLLAANPRAVSLSSAIQEIERLGALDHPILGALAGEIGNLEPHTKALLAIVVVEENGAALGMAHFAPDFLRVGVDDEARRDSLIRAIDAAWETANASRAKGGHGEIISTEIELDRGDGHLH